MATASTESFDFRDYVDTQFFREHRAQLEHAFTDLSKIPEFQQQLKDISKAFHGQKILVSDSFFANTADVKDSPYITLDFDELSKARQFSPDTGKYEQASLQNVIVHETYHLSDPELRKFTNETVPGRVADAKRAYHQEFIGRTWFQSDKDIAAAVDKDMQKTIVTAAEPMMHDWFMKKGISANGLTSDDMLQKMRKDDLPAFDAMKGKIDGSLATDPALAPLKQRFEVLHKYDAELEKEQMKAEYRAVDFTNRIVAGPDSYFGEPRRGRYEDFKLAAPQPVLDHQTITQHKEKLLPVGESNFHVCEEAVSMGREGDEFAKLRPTDDLTAHYNSLSNEQQTVFNRARALLHEPTDERPLEPSDYRAKRVCEDLTGQRGH